MLSVFLSVCSRSWHLSEDQDHVHSFAPQLTIIIAVPVSAIELSALGKRHQGHRKGRGDGFKGVTGPKLRIHVLLLVGTQSLFKALVVS